MFVAGLWVARALRYDPRLFSGALYAIPAVACFAIHKKQNWGRYVFMAVMLLASIAFGFGFIHGYASSKPEGDTNWIAYLIAVVASLVLLLIPGVALFRPSMNRLFSTQSANKPLDGTH